MFNYYHIYPTCPHCLEPNFNGVSIIKKTPNDFCQECRECEEEFCIGDIFKDKISENSYYKCNSCGAVFYRNIDLSTFEKTKQLVYGLEEKNFKIPLIWNIELNEIEKEYINWIDDINGKFLITWPWEEVKFIPIFITEYVSRNPINKIVIVDNFSKFGSNEEFLKPNFLDIFESLVYSSSKTPLVEELREEYRRFSKVHMFKKLNRFHHMLNFKSADRRYESPQKHFQRFYKKKTLDNYNKIIVKELKDEHGEDCISKNYVQNDLICENEDGFIILKVLEQQPSWTATITKFNNNHLWENIININNFNRAKIDFNYILIQDENSINFSNDCQIFFISEDLNNLFNIIENINPSLILFPNADKFIIENSIYKSRLGENFKNYIGSTFSDCLLFSTDKDARHLYNKNDFLIDNNISLHTWDNELVLSKINKEENYNKTAGSSSFKELKYSFVPDLIFYEVEELNNFEELISEINKKIYNKSYNEYFFRLLRSPLPARSKEKYFQLKLYGKNVNFESILFEMRYKDYELFQELYSIFEDNYSNDENPIFSKILEEAKNQLNDINVKNVFIILSNEIEIKKFKKILEYKNENILESVRILTWNQLNKISDIEDKTVIISITYPNISYKLFNSKIKKFIFIGTKQYLEYIKTIVNNRVDATRCRPVNYDGSVNYPSLLNTILESSEIKKIEEGAEYFFDDELEIDENEYDERINVDSISKRNISIQRNTKALLLIDDNFNGLFIPTKYRVMFKHPEYIVDELDIGEENYSILKNKEIILNKSNFMISYKDIFFKLIVDEGDDIEIIQYSFKWDNFYQLINSAFDWRNELGNCLELMSKNDSLQNPIDELAKELSNSGTFASTESYIKNNWLSDTMRYNIKTKYGLLNLYDIEMPKSKHKDLKEIFKVISNYDDSINVEQRALKNYAAHKHILKMRDSFLKHRNIPSKYNNLYVRFRNDLEQIIQKQEFFRVRAVKKVKLTESVVPFKKIDNYQDYFDE